MATTDLGPLPQGDRNSELEQLSLAALQSALAPFVEMLWLRDERIGDTGIDASIEVKVNGSHTNLRSQIQLKSTDHPTILQGGEASLDISTSNLNYLLNGPSPSYANIKVTEPSKPWRA